MLILYFDNFDNFGDHYLTENPHDVELSLEKSRISSTVYCLTCWEYGKTLGYPKTWSIGCWIIWITWYLLVCVSFLGVSH